MQIHGIKNSDLTGAITFPDAIRCLNEWIKSAIRGIQKIILVGFNSDKFDIPRVLDQCCLQGCDLLAADYSLDVKISCVNCHLLESKKSELQRISEEGKFFNISKNGKRTLKIFGLQTVYKYLLGEDLKNAHDSLVDVDATFKVLEAISRSEGVDFRHLKLFSYHKSQAELKNPHPFRAQDRGDYRWTPLRMGMEHLFCHEEPWAGKI